MRIFFDPSALYKRYADEVGRDQVVQLGQDAREVLVTAHCLTEVASALNRQKHDGFVAQADYARIMADIYDDFADFTVVDLDRRVEALSIAAMEGVRLRAMDALLVGTAQSARADLFVTADRRLATAAQAVGLKTRFIQA